MGVGIKYYCWRRSTQAARRPRRLEAALEGLGLVFLPELLPGISHKTIRACTQALRTPTALDSATTIIAAPEQHRKKSKSWLN